MKGTWTGNTVHKIYIYSLDTRSAVQHFSSTTLELGRAPSNIINTLDVHLYTTNHKHNST